MSPLQKTDRVKVVNDKSNELNETLKRWHDRLTLTAQSLAERYSEFGLTAICDFHISPIGGVDGGRDVFNAPVGNYEFLASAVYTFEPANYSVWHVSNKEPMLVLNVENVKTVEGFTLPSLVRLENIHEESDSFCSGVIFQSVHGSYKSFKGTVHWKVRPDAGLEEDLTPRQVQSGSEIMNNISENREKVPGKLYRWCDLYHVATQTNVVFDGENVRVSCGEQSGLLVKVLNVYFGPFNL